MTLRAYFIVMTLATTMAWLSWIVVLVSLDPSAAGTAAFIFFYLTLSLALLGTISIAGAGIRAWFFKDSPIYRHVAKSFRHGLLFTFLIIGALFFLGLGFFHFWTVGLLIAFIALLELAFLVSGKPPS